LTGVLIDVSFHHLSPGPAAQPRHHSLTVPTTTEETSYSGSMNAALCDLRYVAVRCL